MGYKWVIYGSLSESLRKMVVGGVAECVSDAISYYFPFQLVTFQPWFTNMCGLQVYTRLQPKLFVSSAKQLHFKVFGMCNLGTWTLWEQGALMNTVDGRNPAPVDMVNIPLPSRVSCSLRKKINTTWSCVPMMPGEEWDPMIHIFQIWWVHRRM